MRFAVITTAGERGCLKECLEAIKPQVDRILLVANVPDQKPLLVTKILSFRIFDYLRNPLDCLREPEKPPNLSRLWNVGLDAAERYATLQEADAWHVAVLNDDAIVSANWFDAVQLAIMMTGAVAGSAGPANLVYQDTKAPPPVHMRMQGWAFMLDGRAALRADEGFRWWAGDDDLAWRAAEAGGMAMTNVAHADNLFPNGSMTPELQEQAARDMAYFEQKWGRRPW